MKKQLELTRSQARRAALAAQGLASERPPGRIDARHLRREIRRMGLLQIDYVNVLLPSQYQVLFSRLGPYDQRRLDELVYSQGEFTEQWAHEASIVPVQHWPLLEYRRREHRVRPWGFERFLEQHSDYVAQTLEVVRNQGPVTAGDLPPPPATDFRRERDWDWSRSLRRRVLEAHFGAGKLAVANRRPNFQRVYNLPGRVIPQSQIRTKISKVEAQRRLLVQAARAHGPATAGDLADYYRMPMQEARPRLNELETAGVLGRVRVEGWKETAYLHPKTRIPRKTRACTLLSPFDPVVWTRGRVKRLFDFDYRLEIWVPKARRRWGYYVLPFLMGEHLVARVDLKADRKARQLRVQSAYREAVHSEGEVAQALAGELRKWAGWLGLEQIKVEPRGDLAAALKLVAQ